MNPAEMNSDRWHVIKPLLESALELKADDRRAFLDQACAGDEALRRDVESFIAAQEQDGDFTDFNYVPHFLRGFHDALRRPETMKTSHVGAEFIRHVIVT